MISQTIRIGALALALLGLVPASQSEAKGHVFRFQAEWRKDPVQECGPQVVLSLFSSQADIDVVSISYQNIPDTCTGIGARFVSGTGTVTITGNQAHLSVEGSIAVTSNDGSTGVVDLDLTLRKTGNLPDPTPGEKLVSASACGEVILDGQEDLTAGQRSTTAQISKSKN
jgi:hypothetical protein